MRWGGFAVEVGTELWWRRAPVCQWMADGSGWAVDVPCMGRGRAVGVSWLWALTCALGERYGGRDRAGAQRGPRLHREESRAQLGGHRPARSANGGHAVTGVLCRLPPHRSGLAILDWPCEGAGGARTGS